MGIKETMNKRDVARYHKMLADDVSIKEISKVMLISEKTLRRFTPEVVAKVKEKASDDRKAILKGSGKKDDNEGNTK